MHIYKYQSEKEGNMITRSVLIDVENIANNDTLSQKVTKKVEPGWSETYTNNPIIFS